MKPRWHVVCSPYAIEPQPHERIWTVSQDPTETGWETDTGTQGYGLTWADAKELVDAANLVVRLRQRHG